MPPGNIVATAMLPGRIYASPTNIPGKRNLAFGGSVNDDRKLVGLQGSAADQAAVNIGLAQQLLGVLRVHAAAVLDGQALGSVLAVQLANDLADGGADLSA